MHFSYPGYNFALILLFILFLCSLFWKYQLCICCISTLFHIYDFLSRSSQLSFPFQLDLFQAADVDVYTVILIVCSAYLNSHFCCFYCAFHFSNFCILSYYLSLWSSASLLVISCCLIIIFSLNL